MRRILLVLAVVVVMAAMMAVSAMPTVAAVFPEKPTKGKPTLRIEAMAAPLEDSVDILATGAIGSQR